MPANSPKFARRKVESSNIASVGWNNNQMEVEFKNGSIYRYSPVSEELTREMMEAESVGRFFNERIRGDKGLLVEKIQ